MSWGPEELDELNGLLDAYDIWNQPRGEDLSFDFWQNDEHQISAGPLHMWAKPFRSLIAHRSTVPYLTEILGPRFRYDHGHAMVMRAGGTPFGLHGGATPWDSAIAYDVAQGRIQCGLVVVQYTLCDVSESDGGFCALPGSHKSGFAWPESFKSLTDPGMWDPDGSAEGRFGRHLHRGPHPRHAAVDRGARAPGPVLPVHAGPYGLRRALPGGTAGSTPAAPTPSRSTQPKTNGRPRSAACWSLPMRGSAPTPSPKAAESGCPPRASTPAPAGACPGLVTGCSDVPMLRSRGAYRAKGRLLIRRGSTCAIPNKSGDG